VVSIDTVPAANSLIVSDRGAGQSFTSKLSRLLLLTIFPLQLAKAKFIGQMKKVAVLRKK